MTLKKSGRSKKTTSLVTGYVMIAMVVVMYLVMFPGKKTLPPSTFDSVMELLADDKYPEDPYSLIDINNKFLLCLYGGAILDEEIELVLIKQRLLFSEEILELNPLETHVERMSEQISAYRELGAYVHTIEIESLEYDKSDSNICYATIKQYSVAIQNSVIRYYLASRDNTWKIIGWETVEEQV